MLCEWNTGSLSHLVRTVLILVLMEDALRDKAAYLVNHKDKVLILVLMEDALREPKLCSLMHLVIEVLILVLMEDALRELKALKKKAEELGLNPCSNGRCSARYLKF